MCVTHSRLHSANRMCTAAAVHSGETVNYFLRGGEGGVRSGNRIGVMNYEKQIVFAFGS